jgi:hypothetical protein
MPPAARAPLLLAGFAALLLGMAGGLGRLGWGLSVTPGLAVAHHGALMVGGFFGTVISLERAVALRATWAYAAPLGAGLGALLAVAGYYGAGVGLLLISSGVFCAASLAIWRKQRVLFTATLAAGALCWLLGNIGWWNGVPVARVVPWWIAFFVLTIAGERLELNRLLPPRPPVRHLFIALAALLLCGAAVASAGRGALLFAASLSGLALWLLLNDVARRTVRSRGLPRYVAASLLAGYFWLLAGGIGMAIGETLSGNALSGAGPLYDAVLHAILIGFVFSMVFGHAPITVPAVLRIATPYTPWLFLALCLLHATLVVRMAGDAIAMPPLRLAGSLGNGFAVLTFMATMAGTALLKNAHRRLPWTKTND